MNVKKVASTLASVALTMVTLVGCQVGGSEVPNVAPSAPGDINVGSHLGDRPVDDDGTLSIGEVSESRFLVHAKALDGETSDERERTIWHLGAVDVTLRTNVAVSDEWVLSTEVGSLMLSNGDSSVIVAVVPSEVDEDLFVTLKQEVNDIETENGVKHVTVSTVEGSTVLVLLDLDAFLVISGEGASWEDVWASYDWTACKDEERHAMEYGSSTQLDPTAGAAAIVPVDDMGERAPDYGAEDGDVRLDASGSLLPEGQEDPHEDVNVKHDPSGTLVTPPPA